jgi:hypothetical protein
MAPAVWSIFGELIEQKYKAVTNALGRWVRVADCSGCLPRHLAEFCDLPTLLLVENVETDGEFIRMVVAKLRPRLRGHFGGTHPLIKVEQGGGIAELVKEINRHGQLYGSVRPHGHVPARVVAVADSDAPSPGRPSADANAVRRAATKAGVATHVLTKRTIENYIPDEALHRYAESRRHLLAAVQTITSLPTPARDHYPMKDGLKDKDRLDGLYPDDLPSDLGLGDRFMRDLLTHYSYMIEARELRIRDGAGELDDLLRLLEDNL